MKKTTFLMICLLLTVYFSCSSSSSDDAIINDSQAFNLIGNWVPESYSIEGTITVLENDEPTITELQGTGGDLNVDLTFSENPNNYNWFGGFLFILNRTTDGETITLNAEFSVNENGSWTLSGNTLRLTNSEETTVISLVKITDNTYKFIKNTSINTVDGTSSITTNTVEEFVLSRAN